MGGNVFDRIELAASKARRVAWEASVGDEPCPKCPHPKREHCSRNLLTNVAGCCPGYCFADVGGAEDGCECPGYAVEASA